MRKFLSIIVVTFVLAACTVVTDTQHSEAENDPVNTAISNSSSSAPTAIEKDMLQNYLPGKTFLSRATSGMWGIFYADGKMEVFSGHEYDQANSTGEMTAQTVNWQLSDTALLIKFSEKTTLDWPFQNMKLIEKNDQSILSFDESCVNIVGDSSTEDLDASVKTGSCD
jgi:hypothetical protein